jgi:hypothetical protein
VKENLMRPVIALLCAAALFAVVAPGVRADDYNKLTYFTFSSPVQVPGATLPAGKYMFKLADPSSGRRAIQIWDADGKKLHTTLLTMSIQRTEIPKDPIVMFSEAPAGEAPAARSWFYEAERVGYEFVYPKEQAVKIARASNSPVLSTDESSTDLSALNAANVGHIDDAGQLVDASPSTAGQPAADAVTPPSAADTTAAAPDTTAAASDTVARAPEPSANRTESPAPRVRSDVATPVGTTGRSAAAASSAQQATSAAAAQSADSPAALPRTASSLPIVELMSVVLLLSALGVRELRRRVADGR